MRRWLRGFGWEPFVPPFYWSATHLLRFLLLLLARWEVRGREHVPREGPLIVVSNHLSNADPPILAAAVLYRRIRYMAKAELFRFPIGVVMRLYGAFPVRRFEADARALLAAERILRHGGALGMFPEGHRSRTGYVGKPRPGTALIALRTGAPVLPCAIEGTEQLRNPLAVFRRPRIAVTIGQPFRLEQVKRPTEGDVSEATQRIFGAITALLPAKYLGPYTGSEAPHDGSDPPRD
jgi:1-acyl-sn-glycerol-3-phosphate acyltransferase